MASASGGESGSRFRFLPDEGDYPSITHNKRKANENHTHTDRNTGFKITKVDFPEYYVLRCEQSNKDFLKISPFYIELALNNHVGNGTSTKRLRDGTLLIKAANNNQANKLLHLKKLGDIPVIASEHNTLNTSQGIIYCWDSLNLTEEEILKGLQGQNQKVTQVRKIKRRVNGELVDTPTCILTFKLSYVPNTIKFGFLNLQVKVYIPNPMKCINCYKYGHPKKFCKNNKACSNCSNDVHGDHCSETPHCQGCGGEHNNFNKDCPRFKREYEIQKIRVVDRLSYTEARVKFNILYPDAPNANYSQALRSNNGTSRHPIAHTRSPQPKRKVHSAPTETQSNITHTIHTHSNEQNLLTENDIHTSILSSNNTPSNTNTNKANNKFAKLSLPNVSKNNSQQTEINSTPYTQSSASQSTNPNLPLIKDPNQSALIPTDPTLPSLNSSETTQINTISNTTINS